MTAEWTDTSKFVGTVHTVTVDAGANVRTMTVTVGDGGPLPWWDHRPVVSLTVEFHDGRRSNWASADAAAGEVAEKIFSPYSVGVVGGDGWEPKIERSQRDTGRKRNGSTRFTFFVFQGPRDVSRKYAAMREAGRTDVLSVIEADYARIRELKASGLSDDAARRRVAPLPAPDADAMMQRMNARHAAKAS